MYRVFLFWLCMTAPGMASIIDSEVFLNEFHYDNEGADQTEFIEVVAPESWTDLESVTLTLYNGGSGAAYAGEILLSDFTRREVVDGYTFYTLDISLQNGAPDGLALALGSDVLQFLSYEGTFTAADGVAQGLESTDVGVFESTDTPLGSALQLAGTGNSYLDFAWQAPATNTYGTVNHGQSFTVPEPESLVLWLCAIGAAAAVRQRRRAVHGRNS